MNNGPSWQTVQGCGASLKKQQITQAPGPPQRGWCEAGKTGQGTSSDTQEAMGRTEGAPLGALVLETSGQNAAP